MKRPTFDYESKLWRQGVRHIAGVDEVGRGCFAGPVVAAAVIMPEGFDATDQIDDSKRILPKKREKLAKIIKEHALAFSIAEIPVQTINDIGIGKAAQKAFVNAILGLGIKPDHILVDAFMIHAIDRLKQTPIIHGDRLSISIAAASIIAKVYRDKLMQQFHLQYEAYDFYSNKGYGTKKHRDAIGKLGLCDLHRTSFDLTKFLQSS